MRLHVSRLGAFALLVHALLVQPTSAQLAQSGNVQLWACTLDGAGGGVASHDVAAYLSLEELATDTLSSPLYSGSIGFLAGNDPQVTNLPVVFGLQPDFGPLAGGTPFSITGLNFDKFGLASTLSVSIGGAPAQNVVVQSDNLVTAVSPPGASGPSDVEIEASLGAVTRPDGFIYTPAIVTTPVVPIGGELVIRNYGPVGSQFMTFVSLSAWSANTKFGTLLIGPDVIQLIPPLPYPASEGVSSLSFLVPHDPVLHGLSVHFQALSLTQQAPLLGALTNASTTSIP